MPGGEAVPGALQIIIHGRRSVPFPFSQWEKGDFPDQSKHHAS
jgi:hypothetical protein